MNVQGEKTFLGEDIRTPEHFILDLCDRINNVYKNAIEEKDQGVQLAYLIGFLNGFTNRLNRVCER